MSDLEIFQDSPMTIYADSAILALDHESFRQQETIFATLNILVIGTALLVPAFTSARPSTLVITLLTAGCLFEAAELVWLRLNKGPLSRRLKTTLIWWSIALNTILAVILPLLSWRQDTQYFVLMVVPVLEAAFRLGAVPALGVVVVADLLNFYGVYSLASVNEYFEAGATSLIYTVVGLFVWLLVNNLRDREARLNRNINELERTRERLLAEEKLAAVGRLSSAIAHEIRNPVAMIASSLATAARSGQSEAERNEMFAIAASEAGRLERLTTDFLAYARPRALQIRRSKVADTLHYVAAVARAHAAEKGVVIEVPDETDLEADFDPSLMQQALLNLVLNAVDACEHGGPIQLAGIGNGGDALAFEVTEPTGPIPEAVTSHLFEPFFTTKPGGTGLGLAIARNIARAHGGDLTLKINAPGKVCFSIEVPVRADPSRYNGDRREGTNIDR